MNTPYITIVIPVHNEQEVLEILYKRLTTVMDNLNKPYEVILTNDGSKDNSKQILNKLYKLRPNEFRIIHFNGNYGQHMAIMAGFERARGNIVITMDADLQNPPEEIPRLVEMIEKGHDVVGTYRSKRDDKKWRVLVSKLHNYLSGLIIPKIKMKDEGCMFRAYKSHIVKLMTSNNEHSTFISALALFYAANPTEIEISHEQRAAGKTSYSLYKLIRYNFDLITNFSDLPLQIFTFLGIFVLAVSSLSIIYIALKTIIGLRTSGFLFAIMFFVMGLILLGLGIVGEYVGRIYKEVLNRPRFVIREIIE